MISKWINKWITDTASSIMNFAVSASKAIVDQINQSLPVIKTWYGIFLAFATSLVVVVVLARIIMTIIKEADESTDVTWANIIMDATKSAIAIPVMVFLQGFLQTYITAPLAKAMFDMSGKYSAEAIIGTSKIPINHSATGAGASIDVGTGMTMVFLLFFTVVTIAFMVKMSIYFADMLWYTLTIPFAAISIATETFDYGTTWWKKLVYYNASMLSQVLSLTLCIWCFTHIATSGFIAFMGAIGFGWLVLHTPNVIQDFWTSTGITKKSGVGAMRMLQNFFRKN